MANCGKEILLKREGSDQFQRYIDALNPESVELFDFKLKEWLKFAFQFASHVNYFNSKNPDVAAGDWQHFFKSDDELNDFIEENELEQFFENEVGNQNITPHLALYICFIKLMDLVKNRFNKLTKRHLDYYYQQILQIEKLPATPDKVHAIFELAKNSDTIKIAEFTQLDAGKDSNGTKRIYKTSEEIVVNKIKVEQLKSVYNDHQHKKIKAAPVANSYDGEGKDFPDNDVKWWPFGYVENGASGKENEYEPLNDATLGFALSSAILAMHEGKRTVNIQVNFTSEIIGINAELFQKNLEVYCTGEKGWLGPFSVTASGFTIKNKELPGGFKKEVLPEKIKKTFNTNSFNLSFTVPKEEKALDNYDSEIHGERFESANPVCRILIKTRNTSGHSLYRKLAQKEIASLTLSVEVEDIENLTLQNDTGTINPKKPFFPFGTQPIKKTNFQVDYTEMFEKNWQHFTLDITWKDTPGNFKNHYYAYRDNFLGSITTSDFVKEIKEGDNFIVTGSSYFTASAEIKNKRSWVDAEIELLKTTKKGNIESLMGILEKEGKETTSKETPGIDSLIINSFVLFNEKADGAYRTKLKVNFNKALLETYKTGPFRLSLDESFLHSLFPKIYALAMSARDPAVAIPNEPYTPLIEKITLGYSASETAGFASEKYTENQVKLFHEHPFGQAEQHQYLGDSEIFLVPSYCKGGELYIGLSQAEQRQNLSLLIQVLEGSENTEVPSFLENEKVEWSALCNNRWKALDSNYIVKNETDNFLASGILKLTIPAEATSKNTVLPDGLTWIKASMFKNYDAVCKVIGIHAQAILSRFSDNKNELSHLEDGLEAKSISKMINRIPGIKSVSQPYNSYGGLPLESDDAYYRRVSERLRHKKRAISLWDYEHLVLQEFPEIHKIKCLNHTKTEVVYNERKTSYLAPGNVTLVVIPDIVNKNVFDIYQPRVSTALLNRISGFVKRLNSLHVNLYVINPEYEEVRVNLNVKFHKGYDENYYETILNDDITKLLSPWAFDNAASINFGLSFHKSLLINYIEELKYVDYVENVELYQKKFTSESFNNVKVAVPSSPEAILVSAKSHVIGTTVNGCSNSTNQPAETCQS